MWYASVALIFIGFGMLADLLRSEQWPVAIARRAAALVSR
jgi:hypothetical protein